MFIGIDASRAFRPLLTGTERYSLEIIRHLLALPEAIDHRWRLYTDIQPDFQSSFSFQGVADYPHAEIVHIPGYPMWTHRVLPKALMQDRPDVYFVPAHVIPFHLRLKRSVPSVLTVHDVGYRYFPESHGIRQRTYLDITTRWGTNAASEIIAISQSTSDDLSRFYGVPNHKMNVILEGPPTFSRAKADTTMSSKGGSGGEVRPRRFGLERPYALFVGTLQPRKNLVRLLQAYAKLYDRQRPEWDLVLVGAKGWLSNEIEDLAERLSGAVHMLGYVDDALLPPLLEGAKFFCFPSLFEGFGLPVLEAQHYGIPVMTSNNSSLPEVAGDAALLVDPLNIDEIADAMLRLSQDEELRQQLIAAGYENVKRFSWEKAARETLGVLEKAAGMKA